jgi:hypothetical protein
VTKAIIVSALLAVSATATGSTQQLDRKLETIECRMTTEKSDSAHGTRVGPALKDAGIRFAAGLEFVLIVDRFSSGEGRLEYFIAIPLLSSLLTFATVFIATNK